MIQRINLSLILESCENPTFVKDFAHTVSLLSFFLDDSSNISFWIIPPIFPFFTRTYCNYIWSGPACQSLRGKEAEARNATRQPAPCLMSFTGSTKKSFLLRMPYLFLFFTGWCKTVLAVTCESGYCKFG